MLTIRYTELCRVSRAMAHWADMSQWLAAVCAPSASSSRPKKLAYCYGYSTCVPLRSLVQNGSHTNNLQIYSDFIEQPVMDSSLHMLGTRASVPYLRKGLVGTLFYRSLDASSSRRPHQINKFAFLAGPSTERPRLQCTARTASPFVCKCLNTYQVRYYTSCRAM